MRGNYVYGGAETTHQCPYGYDLAISGKSALLLQRRNLAQGIILMGSSVMNHFPRSERREAFTLIEVMLAAAVMLAGIVGMIQVIASGSEMLDLARKQTIATQIIQNEIGKLHLADWSTVSSYTNTDATLGTLITSTITDSTNSSYQRAAVFFQNFRCYRYVSPVRTDLIKVTFTVKWDTGNVGRSYVRTFSRTGSTYVSKNGLYVSYQRT